jgi:antitoxin HigA-1
MMMAIRTEDVSGLDFSNVTGTERIGSVTPREVLKEEFMVPLGLSGAPSPSNRITEIAAVGRAISVETAIMFGDRIGTTARFWFNLQKAYHMEVSAL